uniref:Uncharacterized protein n=1 Tax=Aegilops tauschii subsp. strangulata TaxID=200361 RepID=A0A453IAE3_AEGTS
IILGYQLHKHLWLGTKDQLQYYSSQQYAVPAISVSLDMVTGWFSQPLMLYLQLVYRWTWLQAGSISHLCYTCINTLHWLFFFHAFALPF